MMFLCIKNTYQLVDIHHAFNTIKGDGKMPKFYGESFNIVSEEGQTFEDAMLIKNSSIDSSEVDFGYDTLSSEDKQLVNEIVDSLES